MGQVNNEAQSQAAPGNSAQQGEGVQSDVVTPRDDQGGEALTVNAQGSEEVTVNTQQAEQQSAQQAPQPTAAEPEPQAEERTPQQLQDETESNRVTDREIGSEGAPASD